MEYDLEVIIYVILSVLTVVGVYGFSSIYAKNKVKECSIEEIEEYSTTHDIPTGLCTLTYKTKKGTGQLIDNNILIKFALSKVNVDNFYLVKEGGKPTSLLIGNDLINLKDSKISAINSKNFGRIIYLFLLVSLCVSNVNLDGPVSSLVFLVVGFICAVIADKLSELKIVNLLNK